MVDLVFNLVCVHPFGQYTKGQLITDPKEVASLSDDRDHHFVRVAAIAGAIPDVDLSPPAKK